jgi:DNA-binding protein HU-beta
MPVSKPNATKPGKPVTIKHLAAALAEQHQLTKRGGEALLQDLVVLITKHLKKGERIRLAGLGILQVRKRAARMGRNPATGEAIKIKASKKVAFRAAKDLKEAI